MKNNTREEMKEHLDKVEEIMETADSNLDAVKEELQEANLEVDEQGDIENIQERLRLKIEEYDDLFNKYQRLQADFSNFKKRVEKEKSETYLFANEKIAEDLLAILDNLERAVDSQEETKKEDSFYQGVVLVLKQFKEILSKHGINEIDALGKPFDMHLHYAVMQEDSEEEVNHVIEVLQKGYTIHNRTLRPAMVKVSK